jgi:hypothetical protein
MLIAWLIAKSFNNQAATEQFSGNIGSDLECLGTGCGRTLHDTYRANTSNGARIAKKLVHTGTHAWSSTCATMPACKHAWGVLVHMRPPRSAGYLGVAPNHQNWSRNVCGRSCENCVRVLYRVPAIPTHIYKII